MLRSACVGALLLVLSACDRQDDASDLNLFNGKRIAEEEMPAVTAIKTFGLCTGTFVSSTTMITAAHCVGRPNASGIVTDPVTLDRRGGVRAVKTFANPAYRSGEHRADLAVVVFPEGTAKHTVPLLQRDPRSGEQLTVVGYGELGFGRGGEGVKRMGTNTVTTVGAYVRFDARNRTSGDAEGVNVTVGRGDSGGPMLIEGSLAAVASYYEGGLDTSRYINLRSEFSRDFLKLVATQGADIPGLDGTTVTPLKASDDIFAMVASRDDATALDLVVGTEEGLTDLALCVGVAAKDCKEGARGFQRLARDAERTGRRLHRTVAPITPDAAFEVVIIGKHARDGAVYRRVALRRN